MKEIIIIAGPNGSGKTTLAKQLDLIRLMKNCGRFWLRKKSKLKLLTKFRFGQKNVLKTFIQLTKGGRFNNFTVKTQEKRVKSL